VGEVRARVARAVAELGAHGRRALGREHVDLGTGEVGQPARVVEVEVGDGDVADVGRVEAQAADLLHGRLTELGLRAKADRERHAETSVRAGDVVSAEAGVDQHEAVPGLDQQAVAAHARAPEAALAGDQSAPVRAEGAAVEVVNRHPGVSLSHARGWRARPLRQLRWPP
jgi:hypothetical protein